MRTGKLLRWAVLAAILTAALPTPGSAQLGRLIKKKIRETVVEAAIAHGSSGTDGMSGLSRVRDATAAAGPVFDGYTLEITSAVMDRLAEALAVSAAKKDLSGARVARKGGQEELLALGGFTAMQLATLKERILPFCVALDEAQAAGSAVRLPAGASGIHYVYTSGEIEVMRARCSQLAPILKAVP